MTMGAMGAGGGWQRCGYWGLLVCMQLGRCIWLQEDARPAPPACVQWLRRDRSHPATRLARRCGSSASEQLSMGGSLEGAWCRSFTGLQLA